MGCKIDALIERHGLTVPDPGFETMDEYLVSRWTGADGRSADGYKSLTERFNKRLLKQLYDDHGRDTVSVHLDREYEIITGDDELERQELGADFATDGLEIDDVASELVSWSTMRHHLKGCLEAEKVTSTATTDWEANTVQMARDQAANKARSVLSSLTSKGRLRDGEEAHVDVQVKLSCPDCSVRVPFENAVERGYICETHSEPSSEESVRERVRNQSSVIGIPYAVVGAVQTAFLGEPLLLEATTVAAL